MRSRKGKITKKHFKRKEKKGKLQSLQLFLQKSFQVICAFVYICYHRQTNPNWLASC